MGSRMNTMRLGAFVFCVCLYKSLVCIIVYNLLVEKSLPKVPLRISHIVTNVRDPTWNLYRYLQNP
jgi:hypothetical protein